MYVCFNWTKINTCLILSSPCFLWGNGINSLWCILHQDLLRCPYNGKEYDEENGQKKVFKFLKVWRGKEEAAERPPKDPELGLLWVGQQCIRITWELFMSAATQSDSIGLEGSPQVTPTPTPADAEAHKTKGCWNRPRKTRGVQLRWGPRKASALWLQTNPQTGWSLSEWH